MYKVNFSLLWFVLSKKFLAYPKVKNVFLNVLQKFIVLNVIFWPIIHFDLIFMCVLLNMKIQFFQHHLLKSYHLIVLLNLVHHQICPFMQENKRHKQKMSLPCRCEVKEWKCGMLQSVLGPLSVVLLTQGSRCKYGRDCDEEQVYYVHAREKQLGHWTACHKERLLTLKQQEALS